ncbi:MAG: hypothetical protein L3J10_05425 [Sulfurimonas sp.]|nr:hypothetical protein [Sulfurimonas sp.]
MQHNKVGELKLFKLFGHFSLLISLLFITSLNAKSFEDFKRFESQSFNAYKDERDSAFNKYLLQHWKIYNVQNSTPLYEKSKPRDIIPASEKKLKPVGPKISIYVKKISQEKTVFDEKSKEKKDISFDFFGSYQEFNIPNGIKEANFYPQNQKGISNFFSKVASSEYDGLISNIKNVSKKMDLNDWGVYLLIVKISNTLFTNQDNSKLLSWFIFNKMGYAVKIGLAKKHVVLMHYSKKTIYSTPHYKFKDKKYYVVANYAKKSVGRVFSYNQNYPGSDKELDLSLKKLPNLPLSINKKTLEFKHFGNIYSVPYEYNKNIIDFMATYPQADYETFFNAPLDYITYESIAISLKKHIDGKKASDALNFILSFVQKAFIYERDDKQFGREKVMFAQETLFFDKSDCEDRAVLFSYLVKELFSIGIIGVKYKNHMATALNIPIKGDTVRVETKKFVLADPTYINATIGMSMLEYRNIQPQSYVIVKK